jgi:hypothetical protein
MSPRLKSRGPPAAYCGAQGSATVSPLPGLLFRLFGTALWRQMCRNGGTLAKPPQCVPNLSDKQRSWLVRQVGTADGENTDLVFEWPRGPIKYTVCVRTNSAQMLGPQSGPAFVGRVSTRRPGHNVGRRGRRVTYGDTNTSYLSALAAPMWPGCSLQVLS